MIIFAPKEKSRENHGLFHMVFQNGFEPLLAESESDVLPLHYWKVWCIAAPGYKYLKIGLIKKINLSPVSNNVVGEAIMGGKRLYFDHFIILFIGWFVLQRFRDEFYNSQQGTAYYYHGFKSEMDEGLHYIPILFSEV